MASDDFNSQSAGYETKLLAISAIQTEINKHRKNQFFCCCSYKIIDRNNLELGTSLTDTLAHVRRRQKHIHRLKYIHALQHTHSSPYESSERVREAADTMECLSMQETLCLGGRGALKEFAEGHPTSPWTEPAPPHQRERAMEREKERERRGGWKIKIESTRLWVGRETDGEKEGDRAGEGAATRCFGLVPAPGAQLLLAGQMCGSP